MLLFTAIVLSLWNNEELANFFATCAYWLLVEGVIFLLIGYIGWKRESIL